MDRPLVKLYIILAAALALAVLTVPVIVSRTSVISVKTATRVNLLTYNSRTVPDAPAPMRDKGNVVIVMDDGWQTQYTCGYTILREYCFAACISVIPALVGTPGYVTYEQLAEVYMSGWDTLNHTYDHMNLKSLPVKMQREQILKARDWLNAQLLNRGSDIVVYPEGGFSDQTVMLLKDEGFAAGRSLNSLWTAHNDCTLEDAETCNLLSDMPLDAAKSAIDKAMDFHSTLIIILHKIEPVTADTQMQIEADFFRGVAQYLHDNSDKLNVITMTELLACNKTAR